MLKFAFFFIFFFVVIASSGLTVFGKVIDNPDIAPVPIERLGQAESATRTFLVWFIGIFWVITVALVVWAAFTYLTAGENEEKISEAKKRLLYAVIAAAIALSANVINIIVYNLLKPS